MKPQAVLVLGNHGNRKLIEVLSDSGFVPEVWGSVQHSLGKLKRQKFGAVLVDRKFTRADVLEFILNVRDMDADVPVLVIGSGPETIDRKIREQARTVVVGGVEDGDELCLELQEAVRGKENRSVQTL
jgi:DNA-binding NtrC family response regulator